MAKEAPIKKFNQFTLYSKHMKKSNGTPCGVGFTFFSSGGVTPVLVILIL